MRLPTCLVASTVWLLPRLASAQTVAAPAPPAPASHPSEETVWLHLESPEGARLFGRPNGDAAWTVVCYLSCDKPVPLGWEYEVRGARMKTSVPFELKARAGQSLVAKVHPGSTELFVFGIVATVAGAGAVVVGPFAWMWFSLGCLGRGNDCQRPVDVTFGVAEGVGAALIAVGLLATVTNMSTTVSQDERFSAPPPSREPVGATVERREVVPFPVAVGAPLVTLRF